MKCFPLDMKVHVLDQIDVHVFDPKHALLFVKRNICTIWFWIKYNYTMKLSKCIQSKMMHYLKHFIFNFYS